MLTPARSAFSLLGLLVSLVCMVVLMVILMTSMNKATTGQGSAVKGTVMSVKDQMQLSQLYQSMYVNSMDNDGQFLVPSDVAGDQDRSRDTTASLYSAMIIKNYAQPKMLISGNEYSPYVDVDDDYDYTAYRPAAGTYWDPNFKADLDDRSNVSFAHLPLYGERFDNAWSSSADPYMVLIGNRGPRDGIEDPDSYSYGQNRTWGGHLVFGGGHVEFVNTFTPGRAYFDRGGQRVPDNVFAVDDGLNGNDSVLAFTKEMTADGPKLQYD